MADAPVYGVIFDLMGTLATYSGTESDLRQAWKRGATELYRYLQGQGLDLSPETFAVALQAATVAELTRQGNNPRAVAVIDVLVVILNQFDFPLSPIQLADAERAYFGPELDGWQALPGAMDAIEALNEEGLRLAVVSNAPSHLFVDEAITRIGLRPYLSPVMSSAKVGVPKPDPRLFLAVVAEWQLDPAHVVVVGDGLAADIAGAHAAGMRGVLVHRAMNPSNTDADEAIVPDADLTEIAAVPALLARWQAAATGEDHRPETGFIEDY